MASTFSYAQAAKGLSTPVTSSKPTSGTSTPAKDGGSTAPATLPGAGQSWADDAEAETATEQPRAAQNTEQASTVKAPQQATQPIDTSTISSPDLGASSASTITKDDDVSSLPNASSESTWDNKSQASTSVDKSTESTEKTSEKVKKGKNTVVKPLQEAPPPAVNIWKKRAEELKKVQKPEPAAINGGSSGAALKKTDSEGKNRSAMNEARAKGQDEDRNAQGRKEPKTDADARSRGKHFDKDRKSTATNLPPPPTRDQESWPTPETAIDEDRKKAQEKGEKERKEVVTNGSHGKQEWVKVPYTPTVVFHTPLPNAAGARRGGRPGGRGGAQSGGRSNGFSSNGTGQSEKDAAATNGASNGEHAKVDRAEGTGPTENSRSKSDVRAASPTSGDMPTGRVDKPQQSTGSEARAKTSNGAEPNSHSFQNGNSSRPYSSRSNKSRRGDFIPAAERRRNSEASPTKDNTFDDRRATGFQPEATGDGERRGSGYHDGHNGHHKQGRFGSYPSGRDRPRGGNRGGRGNYSNGHQYSNGHLPPLQTSNTFPMGPRSPTVFNPENPSFYSASQGKFGRNGNRSQSVNADAYRFAPYQNGGQAPPMQGYSMYDYNMVPQPMSAVPYSPYVDPFAVSSAITAQLEYYFSVDNLLKDMYLRKHMDSQGFVTLDFITNFNRIKTLSSDIELVKFLCQQSTTIEYRTGEDGQDRLRPREGWQRWVLDMNDRDKSAQNDGPKELHLPVMPHINGFDQANPAQWPMSAVPAGYVHEASYPQMTDYHHAIGQDGAPDAATQNGSHESAVPNGIPAEHSTKA